MVFENEVDVYEEHCEYCKNESVGKFLHLKSKKLFPLCSYHAEQFVDEKNWSAKSE